MSDIITLHSILAEWERQRQERRPVGHLTASAHGSLCRKQTAYMLRETAPSDSVNPVTVATVGSLMHVGYAEVMTQAMPDMMSEVRGQSGTADLVGTGVVRDFKSLGEWKFDRWMQAGGPPEDVWRQLGTYGHDQHSGQGDVTLVIDAMCRDDGRCYTFVRHVDQEYLAQCKEALDNEEGDLLVADLSEWRPPRESPTDWLCQSCPFRTTCWDGWDDDAVTASVGDVTDVERAAIEYEAARADEKEAKARKDSAKRRLEGASGVFGTVEVSWVERSMPERVYPPSIMRYPRVKHRGEQ